MAYTKVVVSLAFFTALTCYMKAQPDYSEWSDPTPLGPVINTPADEQGPALSRDRLSLYFASTRNSPPPPAPQTTDIFVSHRDSEEGPWGTPVAVAAVNSGFEDTSPNISRDGHWLFFMSRNPPTEGGFDIWMSYREHVHD